MIEEASRVTFIAGPWAGTEFVVAHISPGLHRPNEAWLAARPMDVYGRFAEAPRRAFVSDLVAVLPRSVDQYLCNLTVAPMGDPQWIVGCAVCGRLKIAKKNATSLETASGHGHLSGTSDRKQAQFTAYRHSLSHGPPGLIHEVPYADFKAAVSDEATAVTATLEPGAAP